MDLDLIVRTMLQSDSSDISGMVCDISILFDDIKILDRGSASQSMQVLANIKTTNGMFVPQDARKILIDYFQETGKKDVFIKIGFNTPINNSLMIERAMYKYLKHLILNMRTPNIMRYIMSFECNNFRRLTNSFASKVNPTLAESKMFKMVSNLSMEDPNLDTNHATFIVIEKGLNPCGPFFECMRTSNLNIKDIQAILFQTFYTLREMFTAQVRHNDLHLTNIWINTLPSPVRLIYFTDDDHYAVIETKYIVKIYDFDHAAFTNKAIVNNIIDRNLCARVGECSNPNERFDIHTVAFNLLKYFGNANATQQIIPSTSRREQITNVALEIIKSPFLRTEACCVHPGGICRKIPHPSIQGKTICDPNYKTSSSDIMNFKEMLGTPILFSKLMYSLSATSGGRRGFLEKDLPMKVPFTQEQINTYVAKNVFETNFFVSLDCTLSPLQMANKAYKAVDKMDFS